MNHLLFAASVGHRMKLGASLGEALFAAAVNHEQECSDWDSARRDKYDSRGEITEEGKTLGELITEMSDLATFDLSDYVITDDDGTVSFDFEKCKADGKTKYIREIRIDRSETKSGLKRNKVSVAAHDKRWVMKALAEYIGITTQEQQQ